MISEEVVNCFFLKRKRESLNILDHDSKSDILWRPKQQQEKTTEINNV